MLHWQQFPIKFSRMELAGPRQNLKSTGIYARLKQANWSEAPRIFVDANANTNARCTGSPKPAGVG
jgi:hypothetical protein